MARYGGPEPRLGRGCANDPLAAWRPSRDSNMAQSERATNSSSDMRSPPGRVVQPQQTSTRAPTNSVVSGAPRWSRMRLVDGGAVGPVQVEGQGQECGDADRAPARRSCGTSPRRARATACNAASPAWWPWRSFSSCTLLTSTKGGRRRAHRSGRRTGGAGSRPRAARGGSGSRSARRPATAAAATALSSSSSRSTAMRPVRSCMMQHSCEAGVIIAGIPAPTSRSL